jgi:hypothetical protein
MPKVYVIHENSVWVEPLRAAFGELSRFQRGGQRMLAMIPYRDRMREANHGRQVPCCGE